MLNQKEELPYGGSAIENPKHIFRRFDQSSQFKIFTKNNHSKLNLNIKQNQKNNNERIK